VVQQICESDGKIILGTRSINFLEELNSDYINEHFGDLQDEAYQEGYKACMSENDFDSPCTSCEAYQRGLNDAWKAARKIADMWTRIDNDELLAIFGITERIGHSTIRSLFEKQTANEAMLGLKAYEEKQKADDEIKVGDEVAFHHDDGRPDTVVVVTYIGQDGFIDGMDGRGTQYAHKNPTKWTKTGRHFDIDKILEEMKE
jgi:hypothetical protein